MVDETTLKCLRESEIDTIEIALRKKAEDLVSEGELEQAESVESTISNLDKVPVCIEETERTRGFSMMMRDRARYV